MAKFKITVRKYKDEVIEIDAKDKISAAIQATVINTPDSELQCTVLSIEPSNDPEFEINDRVKINSKDLAGTVMKRKFSDIDNEYTYKVLCDDSTFETFFEHELSKDKYGTVHH